MGVHISTFRSINTAQLHWTALLQFEIIGECFRKSEGKAIAPFLNS